MSTAMAPALREPTIAEIDREIKRRQEEIAGLRQTQETFQDNLEQPSKRLADIEELIKRGERMTSELQREKATLETQIKNVGERIERNIQTCKMNIEVIETLRRFKSAKLLVQQGLPQGLIRP